MRRLMKEYNSHFLNTKQYFKELLDNYVIIVKQIIAIIIIFSMYGLSVFISKKIDWHEVLTVPICFVMLFILYPLLKFLSNK